MKIMEIISGTAINGAAMHCLLLSRELARRGNQVALVCRPESWIARRAADEGLEVIHSDLSRWPLDELRRVAGIVRRQQIDVIQTHSSRANFFGILLRWLTGVPIVTTAHSRHMQLHWMLSNRVIAVSEADRRYQRTHNMVRAGRMETIHNFIDYRRVMDVPADARQRVRAWLGVGENGMLLGTIGKIGPRKGLIHLVRALPAIIAAAAGTRLLVVGADTQSDYAIRARSEANRLGVASHILWAGRRSDVREILAALDVYVLPSLEESFPISILEAMAAGLPVVATRVGGVPECVAPGQTGLLVPPSRSDALAQAVIELTRDSQRRRCMGEAGRRRVEQCFSAESQVPAIEAALARAAPCRAVA